MTSFNYNSASNYIQEPLEKYSNSSILHKETNFQQFSNETDSLYKQLKNIVAEINHKVRAADELNSKQEQKIQAIEKKIYEMESKLQRLIDKFEQSIMQN